MEPIRWALLEHPELFDQHQERRAGYSPHAAMTDIWVRYNDRAPFDAGQRPWSEINDPHDSVWYPCADSLGVKPFVRDLMARVRGDRLGGVLITKLAPRGEIAEHVDAGWHAQHYQKFYVAIDHGPGAVFRFPDGDITAKPGDVYWFRNDVPHSVYNGGQIDRIAMICCIECEPPQ